jgi:hypothetical protein
VSGVWDHRLVSRGVYEIRCDGLAVASVDFHGREIEHHAVQIVRILAAFAAVQGGTAMHGGRPIVDWRALGWDDGTEYDTHLLEQQARAALLTPEMLAWVRAEIARLGIPNSKTTTLSLEQLSSIDSLITRAPAVVAQDAAAESTAA